ncbi:MAG TPA: xanthine dehydrogenase family protein subunit M [Dehalococcoidia bacterium]|nr:xanthine dehydrogenase family protein subunit M [Dehalococcoidia bacterium]
MARFEYLEAATVKEAVSLLERYGDEARAIAGGTDLVVQIRYRECAPKYLVNLKTISGLDYIAEDGDGLRLGALATIRAIETSPLIKERYGILAQASHLLGSVQVRNLATIGGNLCHAAPSAETAAPLLALGAKARIAGPGGERVVPLEEFFAGPGRTVLKVGEILTELQVPLPPPRSAGVYLKHSIRRAMDIAFIGTGVVVELGGRDGLCKDIRIGLGAVAPTPMRARKAEALLRGKKLEEGLLREAGELASQECSPISDIRCSAEHRREIVKVFVRRAAQQAAELARGR